MKKSSNQYVNYGIAFALFGILVLSLSLNRIEGFKKGETKKKPIIKKAISNKSGVEHFTSADLKETLAQLQHLEHLIKEDEKK